MMVWGDVAYGQAAYNLAMSIKHHSPHIPIHIVSQPATLNKISDRFFDSVEYYHHPVTDPGLFKAQVYDKLPFDYNLFLDVDAVCVAPLEPLFDRLEAEGKPYRCFVHTYYDKNSENSMPLMVWAYRDDIWKQYGFTDEQLPATQSSLQYIVKGDWCRDMFLQFQKNFANPIPLHNLRSAWGGGQPDELYLNITLAQLDYKPDLGDGIYFGNEFTIPRPHEIAHRHQILSMFGTRMNIKTLYTKYYDAVLSRYCRGFGLRSTYTWKNISLKKHANKRPDKMQGRTRRGAFNGKFFRPAQLTIVNNPSTVLLCTSYYDTGNEIRQEELDTCREKNILNPHITKILNLGPQHIDHPKVINIHYERPTYENFLTEAAKLKYDYTIIANTDIYFDQTINWIKQIDLKNGMVALSRWDVNTEGTPKLFAYEWSQDVWIFKDLPSGIGKYALGFPGCDNKFAYEVDSLGMKIYNPAMDIKTYHLHNSNVRNYSPSNRLAGSYKRLPIQSVLDWQLPTLLIKQPGKVGDILICLPIAKFYADQGYTVLWECPQQYHGMFEYVDYVRPVVTAKSNKIIDLSFGLVQHTPLHREWLRRAQHESFVKVKYDIARVPLTERYNLQYIRNHAKEQALKDMFKGKYALVHAKSDYGSDVDIQTNLPVVEFKPIPGFELFDWRLVIENAAEIHCIDSCLSNFVEVLRPKAKAFYYKVPERIHESIYDFSYWELASQPVLQ